MGIDADFGAAFAKSQVAAYAGGLPHLGQSAGVGGEPDKRSMIFPVKRLVDLGFEVVATAGTADVLRRHGIPVTGIRKHYEGPSPAGDTIAAIRSGEIALIVNTPFGVGARIDGYQIPHRGRDHGGALHHDDAGFRRRGTFQGIEAVLAGPFGVRSLQEYRRAELEAARAGEAQ